MANQPSEDDESYLKERFGSLSEPYKWQVRVSQASKLMGKVLKTSGEIKIPNSSISVLYKIHIEPDGHLKLFVV